MANAEKVVPETPPARPGMRRARTSLFNMKMNIKGPSGGIVRLPGMKRRVADPTEMRIPGLGFLPNKVRNHFVAMVGEFIGTFMFLFFAYVGTQVANAAAAGEERGENSLVTTAPNAQSLLYIALSFGFSLAVNAWTFFRISGGLFNPAVTLGMAMIGAIGWFRAILTGIAQILGAISAAAVVSALFPNELNVSTTLSPKTSIERGLFIEMFLTAQLVFTIFMLAAEKHKGTFLAPVGIGLALFSAELAGVFFTGGSLNPARSFGPCVATANFPGYHWIYWVGPALGALVAVGFYRFVKALEYETANPGQDYNENEASVMQYDEESARATDIIRGQATPTPLGRRNTGEMEDIPSSREGRSSDNSNDSPNQRRSQSFGNAGPGPTLANGRATPVGGRATPQSGRRPRSERSVSWGLGVPDMPKTPNSKRRSDVPTIGGTLVEDDTSPNEVR